MQIQDHLVRVLGSLQDAFEENELAFLGFTGKIENHVRDRIAYRLQKDIGGLGFIVGREWDAERLNRKRKRVDLAVFSSDSSNLKLKPVCLVELKAGYSFDFIDNHFHWGGHVHADLTALDEICKITSAEAVERYAIMLATSIDKPIEEKFFPIFRRSYAKSVNKVYLESSRDIAPLSPMELESKMKQNMPSLGSEARCGSWKGGVAFGQSVSIFWWLLKSGEMQGQELSLTPPSRSLRGSAAGPRLCPSPPRCDTR